MEINGIWQKIYKEEQLCVVYVYTLRAIRDARMRIRQKLFIPAADVKMISMRVKEYSFRRKESSVKIA